MADQAFRFIGAESRTVYLQATLSDYEGHDIAEVAGFWLPRVKAGEVGHAAMAEEIVVQRLIIGDFTSKGDANWQDLSDNN